MIRYDLMYVLHPILGDEYVIPYAVAKHKWTVINDCHNVF